MKAKTLLKAVPAVLVPIFLVLFFQNCSDGGGSSSSGDPTVTTNSADVSNTIWRAVCSSCTGNNAAAGATFYFSANNTVTGLVDTGDLVSGTWQQDVSGNVTFQFTVPNFGSGKNGSIQWDAGTGTVTVYGTDGVTVIGTLTLTADLGTQLIPAWLGLWYLNLPSGCAIGMFGRTQFYGVTSTATPISAPISDSGDVTITVGIQTLDFNMISASGSVTQSGGQAVGSISLSRTGTCVISPGSGAGGAGGSGGLFGSGGSGGAGGI